MVDAGKIWFDGKLVPQAEANVNVLCHTLHYGTAVFEGIRCYACPQDSAVFRLQDHVRRLFESAKILQFDIAFSQEDICQAILETLKINNLAEGYIRPLVFLGAGGMGVNPGDNPVHVIIASWAWGAYLGQEALEKGIRVRTSSFTRQHVNAMMTKSKAAGNYVNSVLAKKEALQDGYDEAMLLDAQGYVSEATGENIFIVRDGIIRTPPLGSILAGLTRNSLIRIARDLGYEVLEQRFSRDEVYTADEAFFCGTAAEVTPICQVDRRQIGAGHAGPVTKALQKAFFAIVKGENPDYDRWLTHYSL
ncbi:branched-chain amino acid transaminase [Desulfoplanes formicivorans]|uniref:Branched-chain-amino-acid aminotransferase n=1 Tax=Desulfoplanes formicivorans TaxID=1592317 RepID=A0A194AI08_9BACT|nr:branched-chain amino acid transaminase [Desulfoplanes formicivorans]GAU08860.1 branched-chain amino acid aminotransferase [Desulfoplanes formicivorans]